MLSRETNEETLTEELAQKKVQSLIKGWMENLESLPGWRNMPPMIIHKVRRAVVRVSWGAYRIGLLTRYNGEGN
ncbi:MAG: hypothetical protein KOO63_03875 [Bacteroidales bacterium]|nr:hypothetical protein [Candidatus Latescibacterota bacterium]